MFESETNYLCSFIKQKNINSVFEIGTKNGDTTKKLSEVCKYVVTLDENKSAGVNCKDVNNVDQLYGNSKYFNFRPYYNIFDLVFIDGSHILKYVKHDTRSAYKMLKDTGFIFWHDFDLCHLHIVRFVNKFCKKHGSKSNHCDINSRLVFAKFQK